MSGSAASLMSTPYFATNQRINRVVRAPPSRPATKPANDVRARLGSKYCGSTSKRSDTGWHRSVEWARLYRRPRARHVAAAYPDARPGFELTRKRVDFLLPTLDQPLAL